MKLNILLEKFSDNYLMKLYQSLVSEFSSQFGVSPTSVTPAYVAGNLRNERLNMHVLSNDNSDEAEKVRFFKNWAVTNGIAKQVGRRLISTPKSSELKQFLAQTGGLNTTDNVNSDLGKVVGDSKQLRYYLNNIKQEVLDKWISTLPENEQDMLEILKELTANDLSYLKAINRRVKRKESYLDLIESSIKNNPERLEKLAYYGFLKDNYLFDRSKYREFVTFINSFDVAKLKNLSRDISDYSITSAASKAKDVNQIVRMIHPDSPIQTPPGSRLWDILNKMTQPQFEVVKRIANKKFNKKDIEIYKSLIPVGDTRVFLNLLAPRFNSPQEVVSYLDTEFKSRQDFKSLERSGRKVATRRKEIEDFIN